MRATQLLLCLPVIALLACDSAPITAPSTASPATPPPATVRTFNGTIETTDRDLTPVALRLADGSRLALAGDQAAMMLNAAGGEVTLVGAIDGDNVVTVLAFEVIAMGGLEAVDGELIIIQDRVAVRLLRDGSVRFLTDPPEELAANVGRRVWVALADDDRPASFGVFEQAGNRFSIVRKRRF